MNANEKLNKIMYILGSKFASKDTLEKELKEAMTSFNIMVKNMVSAHADPQRKMINSTIHAIDYLLRFMSILKNDDMDTTMEWCVKTIGAFDLAKLRALRCTDCTINRTIIDFCDCVTKDLKGGLNAAIKSSIDKR